MKSMKMNSYKALEKGANDIETGAPGKEAPQQ